MCFHLWCLLLIVLESSETIKCQSPMMSAGRGGKAGRYEANKLMFPSKSGDNEGPPLGIAWSDHSRKPSVTTVGLLSV